MKITIFGLTVSSSWGNGHATPYRALLRAMNRHGHQVVFYERDLPYYARHRDLPQPDFCRLVLYPAWNEVRGLALKDAADSDVVINASFCTEGARIIDDLSNISGPLHVFYDLDTPVTLAKLAEGPLEYLRVDQIASFDLYLSWCGGNLLSELENHWHARRVLPLYGCVDPAIHSRVEVPKPYRCLLSYMGTYAVDRQHSVESLFLEPARLRPTGRFVLAGSMYPSHVEWPKNVQHFEHVSPHDHPTLFSGSRFTLNITRESMASGGYCPSGRLFEAAACGTPIISDWFEGLDHFFKPDAEILIARNTSDVLGAFELEDKSLQKIAARAREHTLAEHTGEDRARQLVSYLEDVFANRHQSIAEVA